MTMITTGKKGESYKAYGGIKMNLKTEPLMDCDPCNFKITDMPEWEIICMGDIIEYLLIEVLMTLLML